MADYDHKAIESKWQQYWREQQTYKTGSDADKPKYYVLDMFPYPSGEGLHVGHPKGYIATDVLARYKSMNGFNVLHPMGWDAFGLPAENFALKNKVHPREAVEQNIARFKSQLEQLGFTYDWDREINTTDPNYYKWTQWIFVQLFKKNLAYESHEPINWCPSCKTGLANEDLEDGKCERCGSVVEKKPLRQWVLKIREYADRLLEDIDDLDWPESIKISQKNWIGKSEGAEVIFKLKDLDIDIPVYTTRIDTIYSGTFLIVAPEHPLIDELQNNIENYSEVVAYRDAATKADDIDRTNADKEKTGVQLKGLTAINPATGEDMPVWTADFVLFQYGTGAVFADAHDQRDYDLAKKYNIPLRTSLEPVTGTPTEGSEYKKKIVALVENPKTGEILTINWGKELGGRLLVGGGVEDCEELLDCAKREIREETGYVNLEYIGQTEKIHHHYFAVAKNKHRHAEAVGLYFKLLDEEQVETELTEFEQGKFTVEWVTKDQLSKEMTDPLHAYVVNKFIHNITYEGEGILTNSAEFDGLTSAAARPKIIAKLEKEGLARPATNYKLRDWVFSRQRYWGEPIPIIHCEHCGPVAVPEDQLPVELPDVESYEPTGTGESPLAGITEWVNTTCPECGGAGKRETNTMPQWAGSSWYYLRYMDAHNNEQLVTSEKEHYWSPVDMYVGGAEHATRHLIYARFWHKFLHDIGVVSTSEPFAKLQHVGLINASDGRKMSKRWGNVINPDDVVEQLGADTLRVYEMFMGPFDQAVSWSEDGIVGPRRFLERVWRLQEKIAENSTLDQSILHKTIKKVSDDIPAMRFNTAISQMMILVNEMEKKESISIKEYKILLQLLHPFAPHITEDLWQTVGSEQETIYVSDWPTYDASQLIADTVTVVVQINGKVRDEIEVAFDASQEEIEQLVLERDAVKKWLDGKEPKKVIYVPNKLVSIVI